MVQKKKEEGEVVGVVKKKKSFLLLAHVWTASDLNCFDARMPEIHATTDCSGTIAEYIVFLVPWHCLMRFLALGGLG